MTNNKSILCRDINGNVHIVNQSDLVKRSSVYAVVKNDEFDTAFLFVKNKRAKKWDLPGCGVEDGEGQKEALTRELKEESAITINNEPKKITEFTESFYDVFSEKGWESNRAFFEVEWNGDPNLKGNKDDITSSKFFQNPLLRKDISAVAQAILRIQLINTYLRHTKLVAHTKNYQELKEYQTDFWAWEEISAIVQKKPEVAIELVIELIDKATESAEISYIAAGPLEDLLCCNGLKVIGQVEAYAKKSPKMAEAILGVWGLDKDKDRILVIRLDKIVKASGIITH